ncbi:MAG: hypothetical protein ACOC5S_01265 [Acidobacteriota bacterium]
MKVKTNKNISFVIFIESMYILESQLVQNGLYLYCSNGSHLAMCDDQQVFMIGVIDFIKSVHNGDFPAE